MTTALHCFEERLFLNDVKEIVRIREGRDGRFVISCVDLKGCHSQGITVTEAISNIKDAIKAYRQTPTLSPTVSSPEPAAKFREERKPGVAVFWG